MKMCLNWRVLAGLGAVGVGIYLVAPNLVAAALPILLLAVCPLSMLLMMKGMQGSQYEAQERQALQEETGLTREEQVARLRTQQATLADQIDALEQDELRPANNSKEQ